MAVFSKNKKGKGGDAAPEQAEVKTNASKKKPKQGLLKLRSSVDESVFEAVLAQMRASVFKVDHEGEEKYICFKLSGPAMMQRTGKRLDKYPEWGQIVRCIANSSLQVYARIEDLDKDELLFVPDEGTLKMMRDYDLLENVARYTPVLVSVDGATTDCDAEVALADIYGMRNGTKSMYDVCHISTASDDVSDDDDELEPDEGGEETYVPAKKPATRVTPFVEEIDDEDASIDEPDIKEDEAPAVQNDYQSVVPPAQEFNTAPVESYIPDGDGIVYTEDDVSGGEDDEVDLGEEFDPFDETEVVHPDEEVQAAAKRLFSEGDLDIEVNDEYFSLHFPGTTVPYKHILDTDDGMATTAAINGLRQQENGKLQSMFDRELEALRSKYWDYTTKAVTASVDYYDPKREGTKYHAPLQEMDALRAKFINGSVDVIEERRAAIREKYEQDRSAYADQARERAAEAYDARYKAKCDDALKRVEIDVHEGIENSYRSAQKELSRRRKIDVLAKMEQLQRVVKDWCERDWKAACERMAQEYEASCKRVSDAIDTYREDAVAEKKYDSIVAESREREKVLSTQMEQMRSAMQSSIDEQSKAFNRQMSDAAQDHERAITALTDRAKDAERIGAELGQQITVLSGTLSQSEALMNSYRADIESLRGENARLMDRCREDDDAARKRRWLYIGVAAAGALLVAISMYFLGRASNGGQTAMMIADTVSNMI